MRSHILIPLWMTGFGIAPSSIQRKNVLCETSTYAAARPSRIMRGGYLAQIESNRLNNEKNLIRIRAALRGFHTARPPSFLMKSRERTTMKRGFLFGLGSFLIVSIIVGL